MSHADSFIDRFAADPSMWDSITLETEEIAAIFEENGEEEWEAFRSAVKQKISQFDDQEN